MQQAAAFAPLGPGCPATRPASQSRRALPRRKTACSGAGRQDRGTEQPLGASGVGTLLAGLALTTLVGPAAAADVAAALAQDAPPVEQQQGGGPTREFYQRLKSGGPGWPGWAACRRPGVPPCARALPPCAVPAQLANWSRPACSPRLGCSVGGAAEW